MPPFDPWDVKHIEAQAPDDKSIPAARQVLKKGGFSRVESRADGTGWWAVCQGLTDVYNVTATRGPTGTIQSDCTCPSPKRPCKHALALLLHLYAHPELRPELTVAEGPKADQLEGLIAAVFAAPNDDLPRLVFADYLEERGESDRAAIIRVSCELDRGKLPAARKKALQAEVNRLEEVTLAEVLPLLPRDTTHQIRRGFLWLTMPGSVLPNIGAMPASVQRLFEAGWVESIALQRYTGSDLGLARFVRRLDLTNAVFPDDLLVTLATDLHPGSDGVRLKEVVLSPGPRQRFKELRAGGGPPVTRLTEPTPARIRALAAEGRFRTVSELTVAGGDDEALTALGEVADLRSLARLYLEGGAVTSVGLIALGNSRHLRKLDHLRIDGGRLTDADLEAVGREATFLALHQLMLNRLHVTDAGLDALARGPAFARIDYLALNDLPITPAGVRRLVAARPVLSTLLTDQVIPGGELIHLALDRGGRALTLWALGAGVGYRPGADGTTQTVGAHADIPAGTFAIGDKWRTGWRVEHLRIENTAFDDGAFAELLDFVELGRIPRLTVNRCRLRNAEAVALASRLPGVDLTHIDLSENKIGMTGAKALAGSPGLAKVVELDLRDNPVLKSGRAALAGSPHKASLTRINLGGERVEVAEAKELRIAFGKGVKVTVWT